MTRRVMILSRRAAGAFLVVAMSWVALPQDAAAQSRVRVPTSHAHVHQSSGSGSVLLWMAPMGTVFEVIGRRGEWVQVRLTPNMRQSGIVMRWYNNEDQGWMHETTVEVVQ